MANIVRIKEEDLRSVIQEAVHGIVSEYYGNNSYVDNEPKSASEDFYNSGCDDVLNKKYPDMDFEFNITDNGDVTVLDMKTGKYYTGSGEIEYETVGLGYPSQGDYDSEAEGETAYYDYYGCLKRIMQKIDEDKPDGINSGYVEEGGE